MTCTQALKESSVSLNFRGTLIVGALCSTRRVSSSCWNSTKVPSCVRPAPNVGRVCSNLDSRRKSFF
jgi:hypothetical protein